MVGAVTVPDVALGLDTLAGGGITGMLLAVMVAFLRRTKETDVRRDDLSTFVVQAAVAERDRAIADRDLARKEIDVLRANFEGEREELLQEIRRLERAQVTRGGTDDR
jgi:hypothetical protein